MDTPAEAVSVQQAYAQSQKRTTTVSPPSTPRPAQLWPVQPKSPARLVFKNGHYKAFEALYAAVDGVGTEDLANLLGVSAKSLPPTVGAWGKRATSIGHNLRELLEVDRGYAHGKPRTIYRLTAKGREVFRPETEPARIASDLAGRG